MYHSTSASLPPPFSWTFWGQMNQWCNCRALPDWPMAPCHFMLQSLYIPVAARRDRELFKFQLISQLQTVIAGIINWKLRHPLAKTLDTVKARLLLSLLSQAFGSSWKHSDAQHQGTLYRFAVCNATSNVVLSAKVQFLHSVQLSGAASPGLHRFTLRGGCNF